MYVKICGATSLADIDLLAGLGVDYVGIWYATGGRCDVDLATLARLCEYAAGRLHPVLVTLTSDPEVLATAVRAAGTGWVQLHGYQPPSSVRRLKAAGVSVIKALHVRGEQCLEQGLVASYERVGVDLFLLDTLTDDGRVGSTGQRLDPVVVARLAAGLGRPFLLAGGVTADRSGLDETPRLCGVDVDSGARGPDGRLCPERVAAIVAAWKKTTVRNGSGG